MYTEAGAQLYSGNKGTAFLTAQQMMCSHPCRLGGIGTAPSFLHKQKGSTQPQEAGCP